MPSPFVPVKGERKISMEELAAVQSTFRFGELEAILADVNAIPSVQRTSFQARLKDMQRHGLLRMETLPRGKAAAYGLREVALMAIAVEMCQLGLSSKRAVEVMLADEGPLWMAVLMAANAFEDRPGVFDPDVANDDDCLELHGFQPEWADSGKTDPLSMFLYFDPAVLAPWGEAFGEEGEDVASATFFYAGEGIVRDSIARWTTGPTRRLALINVTKLIFDLAAYIGGTDGIYICRQFAEAARDYIHRGDFDLDSWLANVARTIGMMAVARPMSERPESCELLDLVPQSDHLQRYLVRVPQARGDRRRPDLIIRLPGHRELRVDAKTLPAADMPQAAIQWRLDELAEQPYTDPFADRAKWTVLYIPDEAFFSAAIAADHQIMSRAQKQHVIIANSSVLLNLLSEVDLAWAKYREEFPDLGNEEYDWLPNEHRPELEPGYVAPSGLPPRIGNSDAKERANGDR